MLPRTLLIAVLTALALPGASSAAGMLELDRTNSRIDVDVRATGDSFTAHLKDFNAAIELADDSRITAARVTFHFRDLVTGKDSRDEKMHDWQKTEAFPDGEFVLGSLQPAADGGFMASGRLTFHGVTNELQFPVTLQHAGAVYALDGDAALDTREFSLPVIRLLGLLKVNPVVHVRFHLQGRAAAARQNPTPASR